MMGIIRLYLTIEMYKLFKGYLSNDELIIMNFACIKMLIISVSKITNGNLISSLFVISD